MLKGKTTIQLFDAKTGEVTNEVTKENLVTNAVRNALCGAFNHLAMSNQWSNGMGGISNLFKLPEGKNFAQVLYGGILLFSKPIIEDVDHCLPTIEEIKSFIGSANQSASDGEDQFGGSVNEGESEIGTNYVKFVWDFKTNECNGDIASICLTSDCGGAVGYGFDVKKDSYKDRSLRAITDGFWNSSSSISIKNIGSLIQFKLSDDSRDILYIKYIDNGYLHANINNKDYKQDISKILSKDKLGLGLLDGFNFGNIILNENIDTPDGNSDLRISGDSRISYTSKDCAFSSGDYSSYSEFTLIKYYGDGLVEKITIPASNINSAITAYFGDTGEHNCISSHTKVVHNNKLYIITGQLNQEDLSTKPNKLRIWVLNFDGSYTFKDVDLTDKLITLLVGTRRVGKPYNSSIGGYLRLYRGSLCYLSEGDEEYYYNCFLVDDDGTMQTHPFMITSDFDWWNIANLLIEDNNDFVQSPYVVCSGYSYSSASYKPMYNTLYAPHLVSAYLGTINNQETVLTKTADKTMKIIYTLTQGEEV